MMLHLLKISTFSTAIHHIPDIIQNVRIIFETLDTQLLEALCDVKTERKKLCQTEMLEMALEKKSNLARAS